MNEIAKYKNGEVSVSLYDDGTKVITSAVPVNNAYREYPESLDIKITNYCDLNCPFCHESSHVKGKHSDFNFLESKLMEVPIPMELAIGGGNPFSHPKLLDFLYGIKGKFVPNITINQLHINRYYHKIETMINDKLIYGIGISLSGNNTNQLDRVLSLTTNAVIHVILGVHDIEYYLETMPSDYKFLILGFKYYGRGIQYQCNDKDMKNLNKITTLRKNLWKYLGHRNIAFDNLAIQQLALKELVPDHLWDKHYLGEDLTSSMYIDAVSKHCYTSSYNKTFKEKLTKYSIKTCFHKLRKVS